MTLSRNIPTIQSTTPLQQMQQTQKILQSPLRSSLNSLPQPTSPTPSTVPASHTTPGTHAIRLPSTHVGFQDLYQIDLAF